MEVFRALENLNAAALNQLDQTCDTLAQLTAFTGAPGIQVSVRGAAAPGDGGGGTFWWNAASTASPDGTTVINPTGHVGAGRWILLPAPITAFAALVALLPTTLPGSPGQPWNNGGVLSIS